MFGEMLVASLFAAAAPAQDAVLTRRLVYLQTNLQVRENVPKAEAILARAAKAGYNGVVLADFKLNILDRVPDWYFDDARQFKDAAAKHRLEIIPCVASFGYSAGMLIHDPNLTEGMPVRRQALKLEAGGVVPADPPPKLANGGFETAKGMRLAGWDMQDEPGVLTHVDKSQRHTGAGSLRIERIDGGGDYRNARVAQRLGGIKPWRPYAASVWVKTEDFAAVGEVRLFAIGGKGKTLSFTALGVKPTQPWTRHDVVFNSQEGGEVRLYFGVWGAGKGKLWVDDVETRETAFLNLVERAACPLVIETSNGRKLKQGVDFARLRDEKMQAAIKQGEFSVYHEAPRLSVLPAAGMAEGDSLFATYHHAVSVHEGQAAASLTAPESIELVRDQVKRVRDLFSPRTYFLSHDEIRVANWDGPEGRSAGAALAENVRACRRIVDELAPGASTVIWSDMFDPHHNAVDNYYLARGSMAGSWDGLDARTGIVNWNSGKARPSLEWFAGRGHRQILAGYYDASPDRIRGWLESARGLENVDGVMYTTWRNDFSGLEAFAAAAWGAKAK
jgi:hypothetical protein